MKTIPLFTFIYEDQHIIAVNKAAGIAVSGDRWDDSQIRLDRIVSESISPPMQLFRVHRIDRDTSGLVVFAKHSDSHAILSRFFENRQIQKRYIAVVNGRPLWKEAECDLPLVPDGNKKHMTIIDKYRGKNSFTRFRLLLSAGTFSVLEALPETGRTHQIRVHAAALGFPVVCDSMYGNSKPVLLSSFKRGWRGNPLEEKPLLSRLGLHAAELQIPAGIFPGTDNAADADAVSENGLAALPDNSPFTEGLKLCAPLAKDMAALIKQMEKL